MWQTASDFIIFIGWLWQNLILFIEAGFKPLVFIFTFVKQFFATAIASPTAYTPLWVFPDNIKAIFTAIPYFSILFSTAIVGLLLIFAFVIFKLFTKI